jgi:putative transposase
LGLSGQVPPRVDAATKSGLLDLLEQACKQACKQGWTVRAACQVLEVNQLRIYRWLGRRAAGELVADRAPGGSPMHRLLDWEVAEIVRLFDEWGEVDRSHRKLAHRGSYLERVWSRPPACVACWSVRACGCGRCHGRAAASASRSRIGPSSGQGRSGSTTPPLHRRWRGRDRGRRPVSRKWLAEIVSAEETSTQVQVVFTDALERQGLLARITARQDGLVDPPPMTRPASAAGPQRQRPADDLGLHPGVHGLVHDPPAFRPPRHPTDQAWTWVAVWPRQGRMAAPAHHPGSGRVARRARGPQGALQRRAAARRDRVRHPNDEHHGAARRSARRARPDSSRPDSSGLHGIASTVNLNYPRSPAMLANRSGISIANSETGQLAH